MKRFIFFLIITSMVQAADKGKPLPPVPADVAGQKTMGVALAESLRGMRLVNREEIKGNLRIRKPRGKRENVPVTFRAKAGTICRSFTGEAVSGIGCREGQQWKMHSTLPGGTEADYRQASSSEINAIAAEMMADAPVDAETERQLLESGWK